MSWRHLQHIFSVTILRLPRRLEDVLKLSWRRLAKTIWRHLGRRKIITWRTSWRHLEDMSWRRLENVLKTYLEDVLRTLWRQTKYLLGISVSNKSKCASNKSIFQNLYLTILTRIISIFVLFGNWSSLSILRIKISNDCLVSWNQLNSNSTLQKNWGKKNEFLSNKLHKHI